VGAMLRKLPALAVLLVVLTGCAAQPGPASTSATATQEATPTASPSPTQEATPIPEATDWLAGLQAAGAAGAVTVVESSEPGTVLVETTIVDPRVEGETPERVEANRICRALVDLGAQQVRIYESDGTTFMVYGHPSYGNVCIEV
jgi:glucose/arabinose dehydrogenase